MVVAEREESESKEQSVVDWTNCMPSAQSFKGTYSHCGYLHAKLADLY